MKEKLIKLATEKGFKSELLQRDLSDDNYYYLWCCLLQKWLREKHCFIIDITGDFIYCEDSHINVFSGTYDVEIFTKEGFEPIYYNKSYKEAQEKALLKCLQIIKNDN